MGDSTAYSITVKGFPGEALGMMTALADRVEFDPPQFFPDSGEWSMAADGHWAGRALDLADKVREFLDARTMVPFAFQVQEDPHHEFTGELIIYVPTVSEGYYTGECDGYGAIVVQASLLNTALDEFLAHRTWTGTAQLVERVNALTGRPWTEAYNTFKTGVPA